MGPVIRITSLYGMSLRSLGESGAAFSLQIPVSRRGLLRELQPPRGEAPPRLSLPSGPVRSLLSAPRPSARALPHASDPLDHPCALGAPRSHRPSPGSSLRDDPWLASYRWLALIASI